MFWQEMLSHVDGGLTAADASIIRLMLESRAHLDTVTAELDKVETLTVSGSTGQPKVHPLVGVEAGRRAELASLVRQWKNGSGY